MSIFPTPKPIDPAVELAAASPDDALHSAHTAAEGAAALRGSPQRSAPVLRVRARPERALRVLDASVASPAAAMEDAPNAAREPPEVTRIGMGSEGSSEPPRLDAGNALQFLATVLAHSRFSAAAAAFVTELAATLGFDRVALGFLENGHVSVAAVSHTADFATQSDLVRAVAEAMDEALAQNETVGYPAADSSRHQITLGHAALVRRYGGSALTIPLVSTGVVVGALTLQRFTGTFAPEEVARCEHLACFAGPILELKRKEEEPWTRRLHTRVRAAWRALCAPGHVGRKAIVFGSALALLGLLFVPVEYHVRAPARLEGSVQRVLVAPMDGFLRQANARPGDSVKAGQVLVELAEQDLYLERRRRQSELAQHESAYMSALARSDRTQYAIAHAKASEVHAQLELVDEQLARSRVQAPFDGVVIKGDPGRSLGAPVQRGEVLLTIAPRDEYRLILEVDERDIAQIEPGQKGQLALAALADGALPFSVLRVTPVSNAREGRNYFEVAGELAAAHSALRPGLEGVAKIRAADRPLAWIWFHRLIDWARITLWTWGA